MVGEDSSNFKIKGTQNTKLYKGAMVCPDNKQRAVPLYTKWKISILMMI